MDNLVVTSVWDEPGTRRWRTCGKLWMASLLRHQWGGGIRVGRNFEEVMFVVGRVGLDEEVFDKSVHLPAGERIERVVAGRARCLALAEGVAEPAGYGWVVLADADCVALRNPDHLFVRDADVLVARADGGPDPGLVAVRGERLPDLVTQLRAAGGLNGWSLQEVTRAGGWRVRNFERGEVVRGGDPGVGLKDLADAALVHFGGMELADKQRLAFALHMMAVYGDKDGLFFDLLET